MGEGDYLMFQQKKKLSCANACAVLEVLLPYHCSLKTNPSHQKNDSISLLKN